MIIIAIYKIQLLDEMLWKYLLNVLANFNLRGREDVQINSIINK